MGLTGFNRARRQMADEKQPKKKRKSKNKKQKDQAGKDK